MPQLSRERRDYHPLLQTINGQSRSPESKSGSPKDVRTPRQPREKSVDTDASPLSSSESDTSEQIKPEPSNTNVLGNEFKDVKKEVLGNGRKKSGDIQLAKPARLSAVLSRAATAAAAAAAAAKAPVVKVEEVDLVDDEDVMDPWPKPNKRRKLTTYTSSRNIHASDKGSTKTAPPAPGSNFQAPSAPVITPPRKHGAKFNMPPPPQQQRSLRSTRSRLTDQFSLGPDIVSPERPGAKQLFDFPAEPPTDGTNSSSVAASDPSAIFEPADLPLTGGSPHSGSSSPLSSVNSIASLVLTQEEKDALLYNSDDDHESSAPVSDSAQCPLCKCPVSSSSLSAFSFGRRLGIRAQQRFCHSHRTVDAEKVWKQRGYPVIDWTILENERIPKHLPQLVSILRLETDSHYRTALSVAVKASKGTRKALQRYLKQDVVDVAKYGYYGPKGARVMAQAITTRLASALAECLERDTVAQAAGVGAYVSAVLVPELAVRLVMEDLALGEDSAAAREVMSASAEVGSLLCGDEDEVVKRVEEEDD